MIASWPEPEWDAESHDLALAADLLDRRTGPDGEYLPEALSDDNDPNEYGSPFRYIPEGPFTNWHAKTRLDAIDAYKKELGEDANLNGVIFTVKRVDTSRPI